MSESSRNAARMQNKILLLDRSKASKTSDYRGSILALGRIWAMSLLQSI